MPTVEATAPARIDLAGGLLDVWPLYLFHPPALAVSVAVDRRAFCRVEAGSEGVHLESKDTLAKAEGPDVASLLGPGPLSLVAHILAALGIQTGIRVAVQSRVPSDSGLGSEAAVGVAVAAAAARAVGREIDPEALGPLVRDAQIQAGGLPAGVKDPLVALHGGVLAIHLEPGRVHGARLATDPGRVEESLVLVDPGAPRPPGISEWEIAKRHVDGDPEVRRVLGEIASAASGLREALLSHRYHDVPGLIDADWEARKRLGPGVTSPAIDGIVEAARSCGGAAKACGPGGGGMVAAWCAPGQRAALEKLLSASGCRPVAFRLDLRGLEVE